MKDVLTSIKGAGNEAKVVTGRGPFSSAAFGQFVNALVNDKDYKTTSVDKDGKTVETNVHDLVVADTQKTVENAKYPQKPEAAVLANTEIATVNLPQVVQIIATEWLKTGKKFPLTQQPTFNANIYLVDNPGKTKVVPVRDFATKQETGSTTITTQDSVQVRVKSPVPANLVTKVRKDTKGNIIPSGKK
jgi:cytochrome c556